MCINAKFHTRVILSLFQRWFPTIVSTKASNLNEEEMFQLDESVKNKSLLSWTILKMFFLSWKENYTLYSWYIYFRFILYRNDSKIDFMRTWIRIEDHGAQTRRITRASHSDLHAISENKISTERKTNEIWISTSAHLASHSTIV